MATDQRGLNRTQTRRWPAPAGTGQSQDQLPNAQMGVVPGSRGQAARIRAQDRQIGSRVAPDDRSAHFLPIGQPNAHFVPAHDVIRRDDDPIGRPDDAAGAHAPAPTDANDARRHALHGVRHLF